MCACFHIVYRFQKKQGIKHAHLHTRAITLLGDKHHIQCSKSHFNEASKCSKDKFTLSHLETWLEGIVDVFFNCFQAEVKHF